MAKLRGAGYVQYEVSNWAREDNTQRSGTLQYGGETPTYACRHNLIYWRNDDYLGVGPGAHSHLHAAAHVSPAQEGTRGERRWGNCKPVPGYIKRVRVGAAVEEFSEEIDQRLAMGETMMLGLRLLREGVPRTALLRATASRLTKCLAQSCTNWRNVTC